jgi:hypothetical protein
VHRTTDASHRALKNFVKLSNHPTCPTMSTPVIIPRTAPIPIAAKAKPFEPESLGDTIKSKLSLSMNENEQTPTRGRPCDACRRRKSRCVIQEGQAACALCKSNSQECTFVQSPQPRKRKLNGEHKEDSAPKRRYV